MVMGPGGLDGSTMRENEMEMERGSRHTWVLSPGGFFYSLDISHMYRRFYNVFFHVFVV